MGNFIMTPFYVAVFALMLIALSVRTLRLRRHFGVAIGPSREPELERAMRAHANFCEYVPISLLCLFFLESLWGTGWWIHALGISLLAGRLAHAYGVSQVAEDFRYRVFGMATTFTVLSLAAFGILLRYSAASMALTR